MYSRGTWYQAAGELVFGVKNPTVFLRKILGFFSMAKTICCVFLLQNLGFSYNKVRQIL